MWQNLIHNFARQRYMGPLELVVVSDHIPKESPVAGLNVRSIYARNENTGAKRNMACAHASGEIIVHMDDDDYYASDWVSLSVDRLLATGADIVGLASLYFLQEGGAAFRYDYPAGVKPWVAGATMCYRRSVWEAGPFQPLLTGEDNAFCLEHPKIKPHAYLDRFVATIHAGNTSPRKLDNERFKKVKPGLVTGIRDGIVSQLPLLAIR
jgi:glycosyltransferase involved in cell wall biosynthesis